MRFVFQLLYGECGDFSLCVLEDNLIRKGCASNMSLLCEECGWKHSFSTSKKQGKSFEVKSANYLWNDNSWKGFCWCKGIILNYEYASIPNATEEAFLSNSHVNGRHIKVIANGRKRKE